MKHTRTLPPRVEINVKHVLRFARKWKMRTTERDARQWLTRYRSGIADRMEALLEDHLFEILDDVALRGWPEPAFNRMYRAVDRAIWEATDDYADKLGLEPLASSFEEEARHKLVRFFMRPVEDRKAVFCEDHAFGKIEPREDPVPQPYKILIEMKRRKLSARVLEPGEQVPPGTPSFGPEVPPSAAHPLHEMDISGPPQ